MLKIAIIGPESAGKTALAQALAETYSAPWVPEYARGYVEQLSSHYTFDDVCAIAHQQIMLEEEYELANDPEMVFFDTDLIITKVWLEYCYGEVPRFVNERLATGFFDLYLLCAPDLPWEPDSVREHGHDREYFFDWYKREIEQLKKPYVVIEGLGDNRLINACHAIENHLLAGGGR